MTKLPGAALLALSIVSGCAAESAKPPLGMEISAEQAAENILGDSLRLSSAVHSVFARVKGELQDNRYALIDGLHAELGVEVGGGSELFEGVGDELYDLTNNAKDEEALGRRVVACVVTLNLLFDTRKEQQVFDGLAVAYNDDSLDTFYEVKYRALDDRAGDAKAAYYFAPAFNLLASNRIVALATAGAPITSIEHVYQEVIATNEALVGSDDDAGRGYLEDFVARAPRDPSFGNTTSDPVVYALQRMLAEERQAYE